MIVFFERVGLLEYGCQPHDGGLALSDGDVDADEVAIPVVDDGVDGDGRLAGPAIADDQLALAAADRDHRIDRLQAGEHRLRDRLTLDDSGRFVLCRAGSGRPDLPLAVEWIAEWIDDSPQHLLANGYLQKALGAFHGVALDDLLPLAEEHHADTVGLEVECQPGDVVREFEHLQGHAIFEAVHPTDAVSDREHRPDLGEAGARAFEAFDPALED